MRHNFSSLFPFSLFLQRNSFHNNFSPCHSACIWWTATSTRNNRGAEDKECDGQTALDNLIGLKIMAFVLLIAFEIPFFAFLDYFFILSKIEDVSGELRDRNHHQIAVKQGVR